MILRMFPISFNKLPRIRMVDIHITQYLWIIWILVEMISYVVFNLHSSNHSPILLFLEFSTSSFYHGVLHTWRFTWHHYHNWKLKILLALHSGVVVSCCNIIVRCWRNIEGCCSNMKKCCRNGKACCSNLERVFRKIGFYFNQFHSHRSNHISLVRKKRFNTSSFTLAETTKSDLNYIETYVKKNALVMLKVEVKSMVEWKKKGNKGYEKYGVLYIHNITPTKSIEFPHAINQSKYERVVPLSRSLMFYLSCTL